MNEFVWYNPTKILFGRGAVEKMRFEPGGTSLEAAHEGLEILGVAGSGKAREYAEIVASTVLAGELSLVGALAAGHLARAHQELGRG